MWELVVLGGAVGGAVWVYNSLVRLRQLADTAWSDIDVQLRKRHDLIPNLVETVRGYAGHEKSTLEAVILARSRAESGGGPDQRGDAERSLSGSLRSLFVLAESYPDLRASDSFQGLQRALSAVEEDISQARRYYNAVVRDHNTRVGQFPSNLVARTFGYTEREFFQAEGDERALPAVKLGDG